MIARFRAAYGATPLHLLAHLVAFAGFLYAFHRIVGDGTHLINYAAWFVGAAVLHDVVFLPVYSVIDRTFRREGREMAGPRFGAAVNYVRVPAIISAILLLVYSPLIFGYSEKNYLNDTGHRVTHEVRNWLLITVGLFLLSGLVYVARRARGWLLADEARLAQSGGQSLPREK